VSPVFFATPGQYHTARLIQSYLPTARSPIDRISVSNIPQRFSEMLDHFGLTLPQHVMLSQIELEPWHVSRAARKAGPLMGGFFERYRVRPPTIGEYKSGIENLRDRELATVVDLDVQSQIIRFVRTLRCHGPTRGIPFIGQLDLTLGGAAMRREISNFQAADSQRDHYWHTCLDFIRRRNATIILTSTLEWAHELGLENRRIIAEPVAIHAWRTNWWHEYPRGFMIRCTPDCD